VTVDIQRYRPEKMAPRDWERIAPFVREVVTETQAHYCGRYDTKDMLGAVAHHVRWVTQVACLPMERSVICHRDVISEFIAHGCVDLTPGSRATRRSLLLRVAEATLNPDERVSRLQSVHQDNPLVPYSEFEQRALRSWAEGQTTAARRLDCRGILALGLGAGLSTTDVLSLRVSDVQADSMGVLIRINRTSSQRDVPMLAQWEQAVVDVVHARRADDWLIGVHRTGSNKNYLSDLIARTQPEAGLRPQMSRLRNTWLVHHLRTGTPLGPLSVAAGLETFRSIEKLLPFVPEPSADEVRRSMRRALRRVV